MPNLGISTSSINRENQPGVGETVRVIPTAAESGKQNQSCKDGVCELETVRKSGS